jgi:hypothetical protein
MTMTDIVNMPQKVFWRDVGMAFILAALVAILFLGSGTVDKWNKAHPSLMAFIQFSILSTYGEALSGRLASGSWAIDHLLARSALWGAIGMWISLAFPFAASGVAGLVTAGLWPDAARAFSISLWANLLSGYGLCMMLTHRWFSEMLKSGLMAPWQIFRCTDFIGWARVVLLSLIIFWLPAHTITFMLPETWRVLFAAFLGIALGVILGTKPKVAKSGI